MLQKVEWEKVSDHSEWYYIGEGVEFNSEFVQSRINDFFSEALLYLVTDRHQSKEISKVNSIEEIRSALIEFQEPTICNKKFKRFITFNRIGIARQGIFDS